MYSQAQPMAFHRAPYVYAGQMFSEGNRVVADFFELLNKIEVSNKTPKSLNRLLDLWKGHIPTGRVSSETRKSIYELKNFLSDHEIDEYIITDYLKARAHYYRNFSLQTKDDQLDYLHLVIEQEGVLSCFANGLSSSQVDFFKQDAKANYLLNCLIALGSNVSEINSIIPISELRRYGLKQISNTEYTKHPGAFREFIEQFTDEIVYYKKIAKSFSRKLPVKYRIAKTFSNSADSDLLKKIFADPGWIFYNEPSSLLSYNVKNSIARRLYA